MGGTGSTRWKYYRKKPLAEGSLRLDLSRIAHDALRGPRKAAGRFDWSNSATHEATATVHYVVAPSDATEPIIRVVTHDYRCGFSQETPQEFKLTWVRTFPGRGRWFALCPSCSRPMDKAFSPRGRDGFACRLCTLIAYATNQMEDARVNAFRKDPEACLAALEKYGLPGKAGTRARLALKALPRSLDPFGTPPEYRHPGGRRFMIRWEPYILAKLEEMGEFDAAR
jgi:hypothetical protein